MRGTSLKPTLPGPFEFGTVKHAGNFVSFTLDKLEHFPRICYTVANPIKMECFNKLGVLSDIMTQSPPQDLLP